MDLSQRSGIGATEAHARRLVDSFRRWTGRPLIELKENETVAAQLFHADIVLLSHGTEPDPVLNFGNEAALRLWEMDWAAFTSMPSSLTAEPMERDVRDRFMQAVRTNGYVDDYTGIRISSTGRRFAIVNAIVWNVVDDAGQYVGQAATFREFKYV